jgi:argininosuccinate synthase
MHISHEAGVLEDPMLTPEEDMFTKSKSPQNAPDKETVIEIHFEKGIPNKVINKSDKKQVTKPLDILNYLNQIGGENGIGREDMVENRFIGIKSRGVYETPGCTILWKAHRDIEGITMDKEVMHLRDTLSPKFAELIYNGFWYSPEMDIIMKAIFETQKNVTGKVIVGLYKGNIIIKGRESKVALYDPKQSSMDEVGGFDQVDSKGFINIQAIRLKAYKKALGKNPYSWRKKVDKK